MYMGPGFWKGCSETSSKQFNDLALTLNQLVTEFSVPSFRIGNSLSHLSSADMYMSCWMESFMDLPSSNCKAVVILNKSTLFRRICALFRQRRCRLSRRNVFQPSGSYSLGQCISQQRDALSVTCKIPRLSATLRTKEGATSSQRRCRYHQELQHSAQASYARLQKSCPKLFSGPIFLSSHCAGSTASLSDSSSYTPF